MPECRHYFHGYSRSKDFLNTLKNCFLTSTCTQRPWEMHRDAISDSKQFVLKHVNRRGETDNFQFQDITATAGAFGKFRFIFYPMETYHIHPGRAGGDVSGGGNAHTEVALNYTTNEVVDAAHLPQYVWYWLWVDDDSFALRVMGNVGGEGTATTASEWVFYGPMKAREDENYIFPDPGFMIYSPSVLKVEAGGIGSVIGKCPYFWNDTSVLLSTPVSAPQFPSLIPKSTSTSIPYGTVTRSSYLGIYDGHLLPFSNMSLESDFTYAHSIWTCGGSSGYLQYSFPSETTITEFTIWLPRKRILYYYTSNNIGVVDIRTDDLKLMCSNDGTTWIEEGTWNGLFKAGPVFARFQLDRHITYKHYRWVVSTPYSGYHVAIAAISVGDHTHPSICENAYAPLIRSSASALSKSFIGFNAHIDSDCMLRSIRSGAMYNSDIIAIEGKNTDYTAHTSADTSAEGQINCLIKRAECPHTLTAAASGNSVNLSWTNPTKFKGIRILRSTTNHYMLRQSDGMVVFDSVVNNVPQAPGAQGSWTDPGLTSGQNYCYAVVAYDSNENVSTPLLSGRAEVSIP